MSPARGHEGASSLLPRLDEELAAGAPDSVRILLLRAALQRELGHPRAARSDLQAALRLSPPGEPSPRLALAALELDEGRPQRALRLLEESPSLRGASAAWFLRASALRALGQVEPARDAARRGLELRASPRTEDFLRVSTLEGEAGDRDASLRVLEDGLARLGPVPSLLDAALALDMARGDYEAALGRIEAQDPARRRPHLLARRGDLLLAWGRLPEAWAAFTEARIALDRLPPSRRRTPDALALSAHLDRALRVPDPGTRP